MIQEIETKSHIIVNSKDLLKIVKIVRHKVAKTCAQNFYKELISVLEKKNAQKFLFLFTRTPKVFDQFWSEIYVNEVLNETYKQILINNSSDFVDNFATLMKIQSLGELSEDGKVYLSLEEAHVYNEMKRIASTYDHSAIENVNNSIFDLIVNMIYKLP